jgi:heat shock protein HslJ
MTKILLWMGATVIILGGGFFALNGYIYNEKQEASVPEAPIVGENLEGEADPSRMTLTMTTWNLQRAMYQDWEFSPADPKVFSITFKQDGSFVAATDCNAIQGSYTATDGSIAFSSIMMTEMACANSRDTDFAALIGDTFKYHFTSRGELIFELKSGNGSATFR